jgi:hypothetical protein
MSLKGMDVAAARQLASKIVSVGQEIEARLVSLSSELPNVQWIGDDGNKFREECTQHLKQLKTDVAQAGEHWNAHIHKHADEQDEVSR